MRVVAIVGLGVAVLMAGCGNPKFDQAERSVRATLKDPDSAQFKDVALCGNGPTVMGSVNAKNSYGGYTGFKDFYSDGQMAALADDDDQFDTYISLASKCTSNIAAAIPKKI